MKSRSCSTMSIEQRVLIGIEQLAGDTALLEAHTGGRLVEQEQRRLGRERHRDLQPLLLAVRERARELVDRPG